MFIFVRRPAGKSRLSRRLGRGDDGWKSGAREVRRNPHGGAHQRHEHPPVEDPQDVQEQPRRRGRLRWEEIALLRWHSQQMAVCV